MGSRPAKRRPVLVVQADDYNQTSLATVIVAVMTSNLRLATMPGNAFLSAESTGLRRDSVVNVTALATVNKTDLVEYVGSIAGHLLQEVDRGLRRVLALRT
jgi:mRNA interferase MazF